MNFQNMHKAARQQHSNMSDSVAELKRLCNDIATLDSGVHDDILCHVDPSLLSTNANGTFFDISQVSPEKLSKIKSIVEYAKGTRGRLAQHDREMFETAQRLVSGPVDICGDQKPSEQPVPHAEGEEAFCMRMDDGCVCKPAKGLLLKK